MLKKLETLILKYGSINQFEEKASQIERDQYDLLKRAVVLEHNDYRFKHRNNIDFTISEYLGRAKNIETHIIEESDNHLSLFSNNRFSTRSNTLDSENVIFNEFNQQLEFNSLFQYLIFNKSTLFLDRTAAKLSLKSNENEELLSIDTKIKNYSKVVWVEYKTKILEKGIEALLKSKPDLLNTIGNYKDKYFVFKTSYENWGVTDIERFLKTEIKKAYNYKNYFGKVLTKVILEIDN